MIFARATEKKPETLDYCELRKCNMCGLEKNKRVDFPPRSPLRRNTKDISCRICSFMVEHKLGRLDCTECGMQKPVVAFPSMQKRGGGRKCRICMVSFRCDAEVV
jgi:hypothetical protein